MLKQLCIKNLAIIDDITIDFDDGLNIMTGETGAGKSIIIDAISLIFGSRASSEIIAYGKDSATIQAQLYLSDSLKEKISSIIDVDIQDEFIISRTITTNNKNSCKINGIVVPLFQINQIASFIVDISGQNESQYLLNSKFHGQLLDSYINSKEKDFLSDYKNAYLQYIEEKRHYDELISSISNEEDVDYLNFKYNELKDYKYSLEDEQNIIDEYKSMESLQKNASTFSDILLLLDSDNSSPSNNMYQAIKQLNKLSSNSKVAEFLERLNSIYIDYTDFVDSFKESFDFSSFDVSTFEKLSDDITMMNRLKRKYNVNDLLALKNSIKDKLDSIENREIILSSSKKKLDELYKVAIKKAQYVSEIRKKYAVLLASDVKNELADLYLSDAIFNVHFNNTELSSDGIDNVEFYMSANKGNPERPLIKVASGGEVSRIMLGLKSVFTKLLNIDVIIFDEIDSGVSGKVALAIGRKMAKISSSAQVLTITHLAQVAAMSDKHFYIFKEYDGKTTKTIVNALNDEQKEREVARLLSGDTITDSFITAAKELIISKY